MVASDNNSAGTGLFALGDLVHLSQTLALVSDLELLSEVIVSDGSSVDDGVRGQHVLDEIDQHHRMMISIGVTKLTAAPRAAFWAAPPATYVIS